jgi:hypothetical protein
LHAVERIGHDALEGIVVRVFMEDRRSPISSIEHVIDRAGFICSLGPAHSNTHNPHASTSQSPNKKVPDTFSA